MALALTVMVAEGLMLSTRREILDTGDGLRDGFWQQGQCKSYNGPFVPAMSQIK
jgi:hypothetical protein